MQDDADHLRTPHFNLSQSWLFAPIFLLCTRSPACRLLYEYALNQ